MSPIELCHCVPKVVDECLAVQDDLCASMILTNSAKHWVPQIQEHVAHLSEPSSLEIRTSVYAY